jgi:hypothetical protein
LDPRTVIIGEWLGLQVAGSHVAKTGDALITKKDSINKATAKVAILIAIGFLFVVIDICIILMQRYITLILKKCQ